MENTIVGINYRNKHTGEFGGKKYNYFCTLSVKVGDVVSVPTQRGDAAAQIVEVDVPESRIDERIFPLLKTIISFAEETEA